MGCNVSRKVANFIANALLFLFAIFQKLYILLDAILSGHLAALQAFPRFLLKFREGEGSKKRDCGGGHELVQRISDKMAKTDGCVLVTNSFEG